MFQRRSTLGVMLSPAVAGCQALVGRNAKSDCEASCHAVDAVVMDWNDLEHSTADAQEGLEPL